MDYLNKEGGYNYIGRKYGIDFTMVRRWVRIYSVHGWKGLEGGGKSYTTKFKLDVINYMKDNNLSVLETASKFNIGAHSTVTKWVEQYEAGGVLFLNGKKGGRKSNMNKKIPKKNTKETLEEEVIRLRAENAYLKKLKTLIQKQELSKKKSRLKQSYSSRKNSN